MEDYRFPFGEKLHRLVQEDRTPKKVFVFGVYASAVHARWTMGGRTVCPALAVASEPRIFWDGNEDEAREIIGRIKIPAELGTLSPAGKNLNGPSAKVLDEQILAPLGFSRKGAWLYICTANKERGALVVKPGPLYFNYWKRTEKADSDISFFYCMVEGQGIQVYLLLLT